MARNLALGLWLALSCAAEASGWQASFGKHLLGLRVVTDEGDPLTWGRSFRRTAAKSASLGLCGIGYLWVLWDRDGKTWHDRVAGTRVRPVRLPADVPVEAR